MGNELTDSSPRGLFINDAMNLRRRTHRTMAGSTKKSHDITYGLSPNGSGLLFYDNFHDNSVL